MENFGKAAAAYVEPRESGAVKPALPTNSPRSPARSPRSASGGPRTPLGWSKPDPADGRLRRTLERLPAAHARQRRAARRHARPERQALPGRGLAQEQFFDFLKQVYLISTRWRRPWCATAEGLDDHTRHKADFYVKQIAAASRPPTFLVTNPELLKETVASNGANLVRGMKMLAEDIKDGGGDLRIRQTDPSKFKVGENLALTPAR